MDVREKLVELLVEFVEVDVWDNGEFIEKDIDFGKIAENLIANGVTVQEWISVTERLPEYGQLVIVYSGGVLSPQVFTQHFWRADFNDWAHITHWMPLPQPPKGE